MVMKGMRLRADEVDVVTRYLTRAFGPGVNRMTTGALPPGAVRSGTDAALPDGAGKALVEARCGSCHDFGRLFTARAPDEWARITKNMLARGAQTLSSEQQATLVGYLSTHFGTKAE
jgi:hypothetical protein